MPQRKLNNLLVVETEESWAKNWPVKLIHMYKPPVASVVLILLIYLFIVTPVLCWLFVFSSCLAMQYLVYFIDLQSSRRGRGRRLLYFNRALDDVWPSVFHVSS